MSLAQLSGAKQLVEKDPSLYPQVIEGLLQIADRPEAELRRWCAAFLIDAFASRDLSSKAKDDLATKTLNALTTFLHDTDPVVLKYGVTCLAIIYPILFKSVCIGRGDAALWNTVGALKLRALQVWEDTTHHGVQAACIKFAQVLVLVQSKAPALDPNGTSLSNVPPGHPFIDQVMLSAESQGLMDRLLSTLTSPQLEVIQFCATVNSLLPLLRSRPNLGAKTLQTILSCDIARKQLDYDYDSLDLVLRYLEKELQLGLRWVVQTNQFPQSKGAIQHYLAKLHDFRASTSLKKRAAEVEDTSASKKVKLSNSDMPVQSSSTLPTGNRPYWELYSLVDASNSLAKFNATDLPADIAVNVVISGLKRANGTLINNCISIIGKRNKNVRIEVPSAQEQDNEDREDSPATGAAAPLDVKDEPDMEAVVSELSPEDAKIESKPTTLSLDPAVRGDYSMQAKNMIERIKDTPGEDRKDAHTGEGLKRAIIPNWNKESWVFLVSRLATRGVPSGSPLAVTIRSSLYDLVMQDFRAELDTIVLWLSEEWYAEHVFSLKTGTVSQHYFGLLGKILDQMVPLLDVNDSKMFLRLLSDLPELDEAAIHRLKSLCLDPERSILGFRAIKFLIMFKPTVKRACITLARELHKEDIKAAEPILRKHDPGFLGE